MQWSQIKTIFILCFLALNIYLLIQFLDKQKQSDLGLLESEESTIEDVLEAENIKYVELPLEESKESFISVEQKSFTGEELALLNGTNNQETVLINDKFILSQFKKGISIPSDGKKEEVEKVVRDSINLLEEYFFWNWNEDMNVLIFFQKENNRPVYFNQNEVVLIFLNDENEAIFYTQTMLGEAESRQEKKKLIKPIKAIETLYGINELRSGDKITKVDIGFHTRVPSSHGVQVFVPAWKVTVNNEKSYFVNAIEGFVFSSNEIQFLQDTVTLYMERIKESENRGKVNNEIQTMLSEKIEIFSWGE